MVRIRMFNGVIRTFENVKYVPDLRRNLISLSTLEKKGYEFGSKDGILRVFKGAKNILKAYCKTSNLFSWMVRQLPVMQQLLQKVLRIRINRVYGIFDSAI